MKEKLARIFWIFVFLFVAGVFIFSYVEKNTIVDSIYATAVTLATVGYGDVTPKTPAGKMFTVLFILVGISLLTYVLSTLTAFIIEGELKNIIRRKKMEKRIAALEGHIILCGFGIVGRYIAGELRATGRKFVVVEPDERALAEGSAEANLSPDELLYVQGDPSKDEVLLKAGIAKAYGLISALPEDRDNLFVVLTARGLNEKLRIVSRCNKNDSEAKVRKAGADAVILPDFIGGMRIVSEMIRPAVVTFLDKMLKATDSTMRVEEVRIDTGSAFSDRRLSELGLEKFSGAILVAVTSGEKYTFNPDKSTRLSCGECLVFWGDVREISEIRKKALPSG